jgi:hypothetical protein
MFIFWIGQVGAILGIIILFFKKEKLVKKGIETLVTKNNLVEAQYEIQVLLMKSEAYATICCRKLKLPSSYFYIL